MGNELSSFFSVYGVPAGIALLILLSAIRFALEQGPVILKRYQNRKADVTDHQQDIEKQRLKHAALIELSEIGTRTFTEEQLTQHLAELYSEFGSVNAFVRDTMSAQLVDIEKKIDQLLLDVRPVPALVEKLAEVRMYIRSMHEKIKHMNGEHCEEEDDPVTAYIKQMEVGENETER